MTRRNRRTRHVLSDEPLRAPDRMTFSTEDWESCTAPVQEAMIEMQQDLDDANARLGTIRRDEQLRYGVVESERNLAQTELRKLRTIYKQTLNKGVEIASEKSLLTAKLADFDARLATLPWFFRYWFHRMQPRLMEKAERRQERRDRTTQQESNQ